MPDMHQPPATFAVYVVDAVVLTFQLHEMKLVDVIEVDDGLNVLAVRAVLTTSGNVLLYDDAEATPLLTVAVSTFDGLIVKLALADADTAEYVLLAR